MRQRCTIQVWRLYIQSQGVMEATFLKTLSIIFFLHIFVPGNYQQLSAIPGSLPHTFNLCLFFYSSTSQYSGTSTNESILFIFVRLLNLNRIILTRTRHQDFNISVQNTQVNPQQAENIGYLNLLLPTPPLLLRVMVDLLMY